MQLAGALPVCKALRLQLGASGCAHTWHAAAAAPACAPLPVLHTSAAAHHPSNTAKQTIIHTSATARHSSGTAKYRVIHGNFTYDAQAL